MKGGLAHVYTAEKEKDLGVSSTRYRQVTAPTHFPVPQPAGIAEGRCTRQEFVIADGVPGTVLGAEQVPANKTGKKIFLSFLLFLKKNNKQVFADKPMGPDQLKAGLAGRKLWGGSREGRRLHGRSVVPQDQMMRWG